MPKLIIIGAGLAGLTCAKVLNAHGFHDFRILEQSDDVGGRVRTDYTEAGFYLDRGFQVLFTAYPSVRRHLDLQALELRYYRPGAVLVDQGQHYLLGDPFRDGSALLPSLTNPRASFQDKLLTLILRAQLWRQTPEQVLKDPDLPTIDFIRQKGFSEKFFKSFFQPFYRGILLDPDLTTSVRLFKYYFKMLSEGSIATPRWGLGQITQQLASHLQPGQLHLGTTVTQIVEGDAQVGVQTETGTWEAEQVICATDPPSARHLLHTEIPDTPRGVTCLYFYGSVSLTQGAYLHLNARGQGLINTVMELTQVSPDLAPRGSYLYSVVVLGIPAQADVELAALCQQELHHWFPQVSQLIFLKAYRIPFAQFAQPVGIQDQSQRVQSGMKNVICAGEYTQQSSIDGAMKSGEEAALRMMQAS